MRAYDVNAASYFSRVEAADGQPLEQGVRNAINNFVLGCKSDGIWTAIAACCILAGARTVAGAIVPLVGNDPTNNNITNSDYSRTLGILGNGSNKFLNTTYNNNNTTLFPQNDSHISCYVSQLASSVVGIYAGDSTSGIGNRLTIISPSSTSTNITLRNRASTGSVITNTSTGLFGSSRSSSTSFTVFGSTTSGYTSTTANVTSQVPTVGGFGILASSTGVTPSNGRVSFYSIGKALNLTLLQQRVDNLLSSIASSVT